MNRVVVRELADSLKVILKKIESNNEDQLSIDNDDFDALIDIAFVKKIELEIGDE